MTDNEAARRQVLRVEEFLPCPKEGVWRALTDPDLIARWLMPNDFKLRAGHRFAIDSDPIRRCGLGGTGHCEVLAFDEGKMLRIAWTAADETMSTRRIGEVPATVEAWRAAIRRVREALSGDAAGRAG